MLVVVILLTAMVVVTMPLKVMLLVVMLLTAMVVVVMLLIAMLVVAMLLRTMLLRAMLLTAMLWFENSNVVCMKRCMFVMWTGNGTGSVKSFPFRAASTHGFCVYMYVSPPAISGDAVILLL